MKIVIIEDEKLAADKLVADLAMLSDPPNVLAILNSATSAINWLNRQPQPDLIFMDIELTDGLSFCILEKTSITCPVIFVTAYDEYWQKAFDFNSVDYILKPVKQDRLEAAIKKYDKMKLHFTANYLQLQEWHKGSAAGYKKRRFLVKQGTNYHSIKVEEIAYCYAANKLVCMVDSQGKQYLLDNSLSDMEAELEPDFFFRLNRKYIAQIDAIAKISSYGKGKLIIQLKPPVNEQVIVSVETVPAFKTWMAR